MNILVYTRQEMVPSRGGIERVAHTLFMCFATEGHKVYSIHDVLSVDKVRQVIIDNEIQIVLNHEANDVAQTRTLYQAVQSTAIPLISVLHLSPTHCIDCFRASFRDLIKSGMPITDQFHILLRNSWLYRATHKRYFGHCYSKVYAMSDIQVLLSDKYLLQFQQIANLSDISKLRAIPNPLVSLSVPAIERTRKKIVLFVARLFFIEKRPDLILRIWSKVFEQFPDWQLVVIGDGNYRDTMEQQVSKLKLKNVHFTGMVDASSYYAEACILCSTSNSEGFGLVLTEASSNQVVPICFDSLETADEIILNGKTGFIVPAFDLNEYASKLRLLMCDSALRQKMSLQAKEHVCHKFAQERILRQWNAVFSELLNNRNSEQQKC